MPELPDPIPPECAEDASRVSRRRPGLALRAARCLGLALSLLLAGVALRDRFYLHIYPEGLLEVRFRRVGDLVLLELENASLIDIYLPSFVVKTPHGGIYRCPYRIDVLNPKYTWEDRPVVTERRGWEHRQLLPVTAVVTRGISLAEDHPWAFQSAALERLSPEAFERWRRSDPSASAQVSWLHLSPGCTWRVCIGPMQRDARDWRAIYEGEQGRVYVDVYISRPALYDGLLGERVLAFDSVTLRGF